MNRHVRISGAVLLSLAASAPGCAGKSTWNNGSTPPSIGSNDPMTVLANYDGGEQSSIAQPSVQPPKPSGTTHKSIGASVSGAMSAAVAKTKSALTIEPKVIKAPDAVSLDNLDRDVGPDLYFASARLHESQNNLDKADELYRKALEGAPGDLKILVHYARLHDRAGHYDRAAEIYRQAILAHPEEAAAYNDLGLCHARRNRLNESIECLQKAVALQGDSVLYRNNLATVLAESGRIDEALAHLTTAHGPAVANYNLGYLLYKSGKMQPAADCLHRALELDPRLTPAQQLLATVTGQPAANVASNASPSGRRDALNAAPATNATPAAWQGSRPQSLPAVQPAGEDWGNAPSPDSLPKLLPPVR